MGIQQGALIGPILFTMYLNTLTNLTLGNATLRSYPVFSRNTLVKTIEYAITGFKTVMEWLESCDTEYW